MKLAIDRHSRSSFVYTKVMTREHSKSFYLSTRMLPRRVQWATFGLYGFCRYADNLSDRIRYREKHEILNEINHLYDEVNLAYRTGQSEHPAVSAYIIVARHFGIPKEYPLSLLDGISMDISHTRYATFDDLYEYCYRVAGVVGIMMTFVLGYNTDSAFHYAEKLGIALQLTNILRDIKEDKELGRIYLPQEELKAFGLTDETIIQEDMNDSMQRLMQFQVKRAHQYYEQSKAGIPMLHRSSRFAIYAAAEIYRGILSKIQENQFNPFTERVYVSLRKKLWILLCEKLKTPYRLMTERHKPQIEYDQNENTRRQAHLIFKYYLNRLFCKHFHSMQLLNTAPVFQKDQPVLVLPNHSTWWDGFFIYLLNQHLYNRMLYVMMLESQLCENPFFKHVGAYSINPERVTGTLQSIKYTLSLLNLSEPPMVCIFPQGELLPWSSQDLTYKRGIQLLLKKLNRPLQICQCGIRCEFTQHQYPDVFIEFGAPFSITAGSFPALSDLQTQHCELLNRMQHKIESGIQNHILIHGKPSINERHSGSRQRN
ncbi:MAG: squalene/phytoene synthase family protein [candidate division KSB1 bacterium]|nr:squalene/phytoene synthase family protein [candidate division KSB1 bacterium]